MSGANRSITARLISIFWERWPPTGSPFFPLTNCVYLPSAARMSFPSTSALSLTSRPSGRERKVTPSSACSRSPKKTLALVFPSVQCSLANCAAYRNVSIPGTMGRFPCCRIHPGSWILLSSPVRVQNSRTVLSLNMGIFSAKHPALYKLLGKETTSFIYTLAPLPPEKGAILSQIEEDERSMAQPQYQPIFILPEGSQRTTGKSAQRTNIMAARMVAETVRTTLGPKGMDKMLVDSLGEVTITNDGVTILEEMSVEHPSAKRIVEVAKTQEHEIGDGTTTAVVLAG